ncbi:hypothetical protein AB1Y20_002023 [Prymnesium parvum]|uniref:Fatty acid hydroxylase domain-containing protein n=1 Tax=Prymnesium parvum TaxID=97485 RepID=A0AB34J973_PRYPA
MASGELASRRPRAVKGGAWTKWAAVNGGVLAVGLLVAAVESLVLDRTRSHLFASIAATSVQYLVVFAACSFNLRGRRRTAGTGLPLRPTEYTSLLAHPIGSMCERYLHARSFGSVQGAFDGTPLSKWLLPTQLLGGTWGGLFFRGCEMYAHFACKLFFFELAFDGFFYAAHRIAHLPLLYRRVHKLHHAHTHDIRLISALQMTPADVALTHTAPLLGALCLVPLAPGLEMSLAKSYLLFQEFYGHAGVEHRGKNFGIAPWLTSGLGIELRAEDHLRHHVQAEVNFSKRFSLFDRLFNTWRGTDTADS